MAAAICGRLNGFSMTLQTPSVPASSRRALAAPRGTPRMTFTPGSRESSARDASNPPLPAGRTASENGFVDHDEGRLKALDDRRRFIGAAGEAQREALALFSEEAINEIVIGGDHQDVGQQALHPAVVDALLTGTLAELAGVPDVNLEARHQEAPGGPHAVDHALAALVPDGAPIAEVLPAVQALGVAVRQLPGGALGGVRRDDHRVERSAFDAVVPAGGASGGDPALLDPLQDGVRRNRAQFRRLAGGQQIGSVCRHATDRHR
jgi:hypothetical protein